VRRSTFRLCEGLAELEPAIQMEPEDPDAYFWKGMLCAYLGRNLAEIEAIEKSLKLDLAPVLLTPLYWLKRKRDRPDFFAKHPKRLLEMYKV
jgi:hypothetical protein